MPEETPDLTLQVLLKGCKAHKCPHVAIRKSDLVHAVGEASAAECLRKAGQAKGTHPIVRFNRLKLIKILESHGG